MWKRSIAYRISAFNRNRLSYIPMQHFSSSQRVVRVLGIESTCDETGIAIVDSTGVVHSEAIASQFSVHAPFGGVVPKLAAREHEDALPILYKECMNKFKTTNPDIQIDAVAVAAGPGLAPCLDKGMQFARKISEDLDIPFLAVNHIEAHSIVAKISHPELTFPYMSLLVSGGHTQLWIAHKLGKYDVIGTTLDDALGESFDKAAILLGLDQYVKEGEPFIGGRILEELAKKGDPLSFELPVALIRKPGCDFSFSGVKAALREQIIKLKLQHEFTQQNQYNLAASFQYAAVLQLRNRIKRMLKFISEHHSGLNTFVICGGVAANKAVVQGVRDELALHGQYKVIVPPSEHCGDNGVMISYLGCQKLLMGQSDDRNVMFSPRWPVGVKVKTY